MMTDQLRLNHGQSILLRTDSVTLPSDAYLASLQSKKSFENMTYTLNALARLLGARDHQTFPWSQLTAIDVDRIKQGFIELEHSPSTINVYLSAIKGVIKKAWQLKLIDADHYLQIREVKSITGRRITTSNTITKQQFNDIIQNLTEQSEYKSSRDQCIISMLYYCGLRKAEIANLNMDKINIPERYAIVLGKGNKERKAFFSAQLMPYIERWLSVRGKQPGPLLFRVNRNGDKHPSGDPSTVNTVRELIERCGTLLGIPNLSPHDFRHTFATRLLDQGVDLFTVQDLLGHADVSTTKRYDQRQDNALRAAVETL
ncbi:tyrosine-type recombinase/integrase [Neiella sp. HB171785]|uniref:Tyrosine-type recombinase/integrase n=1 Tax=Neiella litorisoli TaxID=2771431 RepID=A0A8J6QQN0_9GAMM|nr:tyrosine-type recombinase/integrase [Neiella litorisoli]MBD1389511.1 tyrosine-type recombinase/integrase [Neiella litorisoli]